MGERAHEVSKRYQTFGDTKSKTALRQYNSLVAQWATAVKDLHERVAFLTTLATPTGMAGCVANACRDIRKPFSRHYAEDPMIVTTIGFGQWV